MAAKLSKNATSKRWRKLRNVVLLQRTMHIIFCAMSEHPQPLSARFVDVSCPENPRELFCGFFALCQTFSDSMCRCKKLRATIFIRKLEYWSRNVYFLICRFCLKILLCAAASSAGEFRVRFNVNFKLFLYFNSDLLPSTRSFFSVLSPLVRLICAAKMQDSNRYWSFVSLQSVRRLIVIVNFMFVIIIVLWIRDHSLFSLWFAGISFLVLACVFPLIMFFMFRES